MPKPKRPRGIKLSDEMANDDSSELSMLSSVSSIASEGEREPAPPSRHGILKFVKVTSRARVKEPPPPAARKRSPSLVHEPTQEDNPDIAFVVMFRSRFSECMPKTLAHFGPQELEKDVADPVPGDRVESLLCAIVGLVLNRKQDVKPGHYNRALEDAIHGHRPQWPKSWENKMPLSGGVSFASMAATERLTLLRHLILWALSSSESVKAVIAKRYKQNRREDDLNQPLSVQPWGSDSDKRRYYLIDGQDDTAFRVYRESNHTGFNRTWWSVAGSSEELKVLADKLENKDGGPKARALSQKIMVAVPRFEASEEKRRRREYRQTRKAQFKRSEPGFSLYEGRTRGKRIKYTFSDDEGDFYSDTTAKRSSRNTGTNTPAEPNVPIDTASSRQARSNRRNAYSLDGNGTLQNGDEALASVFPTEASIGPSGRPRRFAALHHGTNGWVKESRGSGHDGADVDDDEFRSQSEPVEDEEDADEHFQEDTPDEDEDDDFDEGDELMDEEIVFKPKKSLIVSLMVKRTLRDGHPLPAKAQPTIGNGEPQDHYEMQGDKTGYLEELSVAAPVDVLVANDNLSNTSRSKQHLEHVVENGDIAYHSIVTGTLSPSVVLRESPEAGQNNGVGINGASS